MYSQNSSEFVNVRTSLDSAISLLKTPLEPEVQDLSDLLRSLALQAKMLREILLYEPLCTEDALKGVLGFSLLVKGRRIAVPGTSVKIDLSSPHAEIQKQATPENLEAVNTYASSVFSAINTDLTTIFLESIVDIAQRMESEGGSLNEEDKENAHYAAGMAEISAQNLQAVNTLVTIGPPIDTQAEKDYLQFYSGAVQFASQLRSLSVTSKSVH
jgi:hypothetical protein